MIDLFNQVDPIQLKRDLEPQLGSWVDSIDMYGLKTFLDMFDKVQKLYDEKTIYPDFYDIARVYRMLPCDEVKVVIVGKCPYPDGNANGIAMGCKSTFSKTLEQVVKAMEFDLDLEVGKFDKSLEYLVEQGVLLLNTTLTTEKDNSDSHTQLGWEDCIVHTLRAVQKCNPTCIFMFWGSHAKKLSRFVTNPNATILTDTHPVSASYGNGQWFTTCFSTTNKVLEENNKEPIKWLGEDVYKKTND